MRKPKQHRFPTFPLLAHVLLLSALCLTATADNPFDQVRVKLVDGSSVRASIDRVDRDGAISGSDLVQGKSLGQLLELSTGRAVVDETSGAEVRLVYGGNIRLQQALISDEQLSIENSLRQFKLPLEVVEAIVWETSEAVEDAIRSRASDRDSVVVKTSRGSRVVSGLLESIDETHVNIIWQDKSRKIAIGKVLAVVPAAVQSTKPDGFKAMVHLVDGSEIGCIVNGYDAGALSVGLSDRFSLQIDAVQIARITFQSDAVVWLSDLEPIRVDQQSEFAAARIWQRDRSVQGNRLRLKFHSAGTVREFDKGIGTRSYTALAFSNGSYDRFQAIVGIDHETAGRGDCEMAVEGDGIVLWSKRIRGSDDPQLIKVDISGVREVSLIVRPGRYFDLADHANWANARFVRVE